MTEPLVSIIIPSYNQERYLPFTIRSILAQTYRNWEAIIVDDGSTDDTSVLVARLAIPNIRYVYQENAGPAMARNVGIQVAQGEYINFLDADDELLPLFLEKSVRVLQQNPSIGGVYCRNYYIDENGNLLPQLGGKVVSAADFQNRLLDGGFFASHAVVVRTDVVQAAGIFDPTIGPNEDWDFWLRVAAVCEMQGLPEFLIAYRVYSGKSSVLSRSSNVAEAHKSRIRAIERYFGPSDANPVGWSDPRRRAYGTCYRMTAHNYLAQSLPTEAWRHFEMAVSMWPALLGDLDTYYEMALGDQPRGYRGAAYLLNIEANGAEMLRHMEALFASAGPPVLALKSQAYGNAYLALAMLSDQAGDWSAARRYIRQAVRAYPALLRDRSVARRLVKLSLGQRMVNGLRRLQPGTSANAAE